jgi:subtilase family serine protease
MRAVRGLVFSCFVFLTCALAALALSTAAKPRIVEKIDENELQMLKGNTPLGANAKNDLGKVSPNLKMTDLILVLRRSPEQQAAFDAFVASQYDPNSANYHHWLQPEEVGLKFGPALADIGTVSGWLTSHGLSVDGVSKDRMTVQFSGTAAQVEATFHTEIHNLMVKGEPHISNMTDPQIPMALEPVVAGPKALHNFVPHPMHRLGGKVKLNAETQQWERIPGTSPLDLAKLGTNAKPQPELGINTGTFFVEDVTPYDFATIYNVLPLWNSSIDGTGQTIAIAGRSDVVPADVAAFRQNFGLPPNTPVILNNGTDPGACTGTTGNCTLEDQIENALDVEWAGAIAKNATIDLVVTAQTNSNDAVYQSSSYAINNQVASILSVSYGICELQLGTNSNIAYNTLWQTAATQGIAVFAAAGDAGSSTCDEGQDNTVPYSAQFGPAVSGIASTPYDTAVGGTDFTWCNPTATVLCTTGAPFWGTSNATTGVNVQGYVPEVPWNNTCTTPAGINYIQTVQQFLGGTPAVVDAESACNYVQNNWQSIKTNHGLDLSHLVDVVGTGGGASNCTSSDRTSQLTCGGGYGKPSWQAGVTGIPNDGKRDLPDVSFFAGSGLWNSAYLICVSAAGSCLTTTSPTAIPTSQEIGGTSVATPAMAGVMALINQKTGSIQGNPNPILYQLAGQQNYANCKSESGSTSSSCVFNDIDKGTNAMPCTQNSQNLSNCLVNVSGDTVGVLTGFSAKAGFDLASGLGSLNVANFVNSWPTTGSGTNPATVTVTANPASITTAQGTTIAVTVSGAKGTPTGTVSLKSGSFSAAPQNLANGSVSFAIAAGALPGGTDIITASYSGDSVYAPATGTTTVMVQQLHFSLTATTPAAVNAGGSTSSTVTASSSDGYTGSVGLTCLLTSSPAGASVFPACTVLGSPVNLSATTTSASAMMSVSTTQPTIVMNRHSGASWTEAAGGALLALLVFFGIPARHGGWRAMVGAIVMILALGSFSACTVNTVGPKGGSGHPGTSPGAYTFTVTGNGSPAVNPAPSTTFTLTVN